MPSKNYTEGFWIVYPDYGEFESPPRATEYEIVKAKNAKQAIQKVLPKYGLPLSSWMEWGAKRRCVIE